MFVFNYRNSLSRSSGYEKSYLLGASIALLPNAFTLACCLAYYSVLKMKAKFSFETSDELQRTIRRYISDNTHFRDKLFQSLSPRQMWLLNLRVFIPSD
jgi:hypothetical protein